MSIFFIVEINSRLLIGLNSAEEDEETVEWENEQLRRGARMELESTVKPATKQEYRPAPSKYLY